MRAGIQKLKGMMSMSYSMFLVYMLFFVLCLPAMAFIFSLRSLSDKKQYLINFIILVITLIIYFVIQHYYF